MQILQWRDEAGTFRLVWDKDAEGRPIRESVRYLCAHCQEGIEERHKQTMLDAGYWVAAYPGRPVVGFHINALYSPWKENWHELAQEWSEAQDNQEALKAFVNLRLGETWEEGGESISPESLAARLEHYEAEVPAGVVVLVCAVDVQGDRLEAKIVGFGPGEESWLIAYEIFHGDPGATEGGGPSVWDELEAFRLREWTHASGAKLRPAITLVDSGDGNHVDSVYDYVQPRQGSRHRVYAVKVVEYLAKPGLVSEGTARRAHIRLWLVGTKAAKDRIFSRLRLRKPGPGYMHLPDWTPDSYLEQLTNEKKVVLHNKRSGTRKEAYVRVGRNEALDLEVYALAGVAVMQRVNPSKFRTLQPPTMEAQVRAPAPVAPSPGDGAKARPPAHQGRGWVNSWR